MINRIFLMLPENLYYKNIKCIFFFCGGTFQENQVAGIQAQ